MAARKCYVPLDVLTSAPYSLIKGNSVYVKLIATNYYGDSPYSVEGNGAVMIITPDPPIELSNDQTVSNRFRIGFIWTEGYSDGGTTVLDYRVSYD